MVNSSIEPQQLHILFSIWAAHYSVSGYIWHSLSLTLNRNKKMALFNLVFISRAFFFASPHPTEYEANPVEEGGLTSPDLTGKTLHWADSPVCFGWPRGALSGSVGTHSMVQSQYQKGLVFSTIRLMITMQFWLVPREILWIGRKRRGR